MKLLFNALLLNNCNMTSIVRMVMLLYAAFYQLDIIFQLFYCINNPGQVIWPDLCPIGVALISRPVRDRAHQLQHPPMPAAGSPGISFSAQRVGCPSLSPAARDFSWPGR